MRTPRFPCPDEATERAIARTAVAGRAAVGTPFSACRRLLVLGSPGSGKSTLARELGARLELPVLHLDRLFWTPGWVSRPKPEFAATLGRCLDRPRWIVDGNYVSTAPFRLERADGAIFLDFPRLPCLAGAIRRVFQYRNMTRPCMTPGCPEKVDLEFLSYIWNFPRDVRPRVVEALKSARGRIPVVSLRDRRSVRRLLSAL